LHSEIKDCLAYIAEHNISVNSAAKMFNLSEATIRRHRYSEHYIRPQCGHLPSLPVDLEVQLATVIRTSARHGFALTKRDVCELVSEYVKGVWNNDNEQGKYLRRNCSFINFTPSEDWVTGLITRHHLSLQKSSTIERIRFDVAKDPFIIYDFFDVLEQVVDDLKIRNDPSSFYNMDEISFCLDPQGGKVIGILGENTKKVTSSAWTSQKSIFYAEPVKCIEIIS